MSDPLANNRKTGSFPSQVISLDETLSHAFAGSGHSGHSGHVFAILGIRLGIVDGRIQLGALIKTA
jgi:hypothetical protein